MARPERFELPTAWFVARYSIQLSYGRVIDSTSTPIPGASFSPAILAGHRVANARWTFSPGSTGPLYANVRNGLALYRKIGGEGEVLASAVTHTLSIAAFRQLMRDSAACPTRESIIGTRYHRLQPIEKGAQAPFLFGWRRGRDSNPRWAFDPYALSRGAPSAARPPLHLCTCNRKPKARCCRGGLAYRRANFR